MGAPLAGTVRTRTAGRLSRCSAIRATREVFPRTSSMRSSGSPAIPSPSWRQPGALRPLAEAAGTWGYLRRPVSKSTVGRWLKRAALKPYRVRRWLHSPDPEFRLKVRRVVRWYLRPPRRTHVVCVDEKTQVQILERLHPGRPASPGRPARQEEHYRRHGVLAILAGLA